VSLIIQISLGTGVTKGLKRLDENKVVKILEFTEDKGCNVILDCVGGSEFENVIFIQILIKIEFKSRRS
jgi:NADPH:quinone reductase-like Zn-dependent oxidoreductase